MHNILYNRHIYYILCSTCIAVPEKKTGNNADDDDDNVCNQ